MQNTYQILTSCPLFRGMDAKQIKTLINLDDISITEFKEGEQIAKRDTAYSGLMIILEGSAVGRFTYPSGQSIDIDQLNAPDLIAPAFLFGGYNRLPVDVFAENTVRVMTLHRGYLFELMQEDTLILSNFIDIISNRAGSWQKRIYTLSYLTIKEKLTNYLLENSSDDQLSVAIPEIREIATRFGATRSALEEVVEGLEKRGIVKAKGDTLTIVNRKLLKESIK